MSSEKCKFHSHQPEKCEAMVNDLIEALEKTRSANAANSVTAFNAISTVYQRMLDGIIASMATEDNKNVFRDTALDIALAHCRVKGRA